MTDNQHSSTPKDSVELGQRLRGIRKAAKLTQPALALKMGRAGKSYKKLISRLEKGQVRHPSSRVLSDFVTACGVSFADISDLVEVSTASAVPAEQAPVKKQRVRRELTHAEKVNRVQQEADRAAVNELVEDLLFDFLKEAGGYSRVEQMRRLCDFGRLVFGTELRRYRALKARREKLLSDTTLKPEHIRAVEALMAETARVMREAGDFDRRFPVDPAAVLAGTEKLKRPKKAEKRLLAEQREAFRLWSDGRYWTIQRMRTEYVQQLQAEGIEQEKIGPLADFVVSLGAMLSDTEGNPSAREKQSADLLATMGDKDAARKALAFCAERWETLRHDIPEKP